MKLSKVLLTALLLTATTMPPLTTQSLAALPALLPQPKSVTEKEGKFTLNADTVLVLHSFIKANAQAKNEADYLANALEPILGKRPQIVTERPHSSNFINLTINLSGDKLAFRDSYSIDIGSSVQLKSASSEGLFYAVITLLQLLNDKDKTLPCVQIEDAPAFQYRGLMLDSSRHFHSVDTVKKFIDLAAQHKLNRFHWHLTDDQGWRIEIKKYPKLTEIGSKRPETITQDPAATRPRTWKSDNKPHEGFYTQEQVKDIVAYAAARHVMVIPEIEMPGHAAAAIAAYPELGSLPSYTASTQPVKVRTRWGIEKHIVNPSPQSIAFFKDVLTEVMELFPSPYIHCGGDEVPKDEWNNNPEIQTMIQRAGVKDSHEMQGYFMSQINDFLKSKGRRMIGWDEIMEAHLSEGAIVMSWRGNKGAIAAAKAGYDTINGSNSNLYFDYYQKKDGWKPNNAGEPYAIGGNLPLETVYALEPIPKELTPDQAKHILGIQAQLWCEYIATPDHLFYMTYPRACAMAEIAWSNPKEKNFPAFRTRLDHHLKRLDPQNINYRKLDPLP